MVQAQARPRKRFQFKRIEGFLWLLPFLIPYMIFTFWMLLQTFVISFQDYKLMTGGTFIGLGNYRFLVTDKTFWQSLGNSSMYVLVSTPILIIFPLIIAIFIEHKLLIGRGFFRTTFFAPYVLPVSVVAYTFYYVLAPYTGLLNNLLKFLGILGRNQEIFWISKVPQAWISIIFETMWWTCGFNMVLYIAGMQEIPQQYYESADMDGAGYFKKVWHITLPLLGRVHLTVLFLQLVASFKIFGQAYLLTSGQPGGATRTYIQYFYDVGFRTSKFGRASAAAIVLFVIVLVVSVVQVTVTSRLVKD